MQAYVLEVQLDFTPSLLHVIWFNSSLHWGHLFSFYSWLKPSGLLWQETLRQACLTGQWKKDGLSCSKFIERTWRGHNNKTCFAESQGATTAIWRIYEVGSVLTLYDICWLLIGQGEMTHLWKGARWSLIYTIPPSRTGPTQSPCHNRRCIVRRSTASESNHSHTHSLSLSP